MHIFPQKIRVTAQNLDYCFLENYLQDGTSSGKTKYGHISKLFLTWLLKWKLLLTRSPIWSHPLLPTPITYTSEFRTWCFFMAQVHLLWKSNAVDSLLTVCAHKALSGLAIWGGVSCDAYFNHTKTLAFLTEPVASAVRAIATICTSLQSRSQDCSMLSSLFWDGVPQWLYLT